MRNRKVKKVLTELVVTAFETVQSSEGSCSAAEINDAITMKCN